MLDGFLEHWSRWLRHQGLHLPSINLHQKYNRAFFIQEQYTRVSGFQELLRQSYCYCEEMKMYGIDDEKILLNLTGDIFHT